MCFPSSIFSVINNPSKTSKYKYKYKILGSLWLYTYINSITLAMQQLKKYARIFFIDIQCNYLFSNEKRLQPRAEEL